MTAFLWAAASGNKSLVKLLLEKGDHCLRIRGSTDSVDSLVHAAPAPCSDDIVQFVVSRGAKVELCNHEYRALRWAVITGHEKLARLLLRAGADAGVAAGWPVLHLAVKKGRTAIVKMLLEEGIDVNVLDDVGRGALYMAVERRDEEIARLLLDGGADVECRSTASGGGMVLHLAIDNDDEVMVRLLLERGADVHTRSDTGRTALHNTENLDVAKLLIERGVDIDARDDAGETALQAAVIWDGADMVELLLENGADPNILDSAGNTALDWAMRFMPREGFVEKVSLLREYQAGRPL